MVSQTGFRIPLWLGGGNLKWTPTILERWTDPAKQAQLRNSLAIGRLPESNLRLRALEEALKRSHGQPRKSVGGGGRPAAGGVGWSGRKGKMMGGFTTKDMDPVMYNSQRGMRLPTSCQFSFGSPPRAAEITGVAGTGCMGT